MDGHMQSNSHFRFGEPTGHNSRPSDDELQFLSQEEQDTLHFFEQTIDSLEQSLEEDELRPHNHEAVDGVSMSGPQPQARPASQDIIDLVRPKPDLVQTRDTPFTPTSPDFQSLITPPESHFENKPRSDSSDYSPQPQTESSLQYHPSGCIPTPVLIAQKIAEKQSGGSTVLSASSLLRRRSSEFEKSRQGPPTSAKPARYPANINVILGNREHQNQSLANINIDERRAQMLANLSGTSHPLLQEEPQQDSAQSNRNTPTRSVSFRDPTPEKSRAEALSKLGLSRNRALSGGVPLPSTPLEPLVGVEASAEKSEQSNLPVPSTSNKVMESSVPPNVVPKSPLPDLSPSPNVVQRTVPLEPSGPSKTSTSSKLPELNVRTNVLSYMDRKPELTQADVPRYSPPPAFTQDDDYPPPPVDTTAEFNSYGGKSIVVNPTSSLKSEPVTSPASLDPKTLPPALTTPSEFNPYGGKSKVMAPAQEAVTRRDLPDILSSHIESQTLPSEHVSTEHNSYGGKSRNINPTSRPSEGHSRTLKPPPPTPAPRPPRHSYHGQTSAQKPPQRALSPEHRRRTGSLFRPQGITVQFSGKGATDESRREALRKLGLLKD